MPAAITVFTFRGAPISQNPASVLYFGDRGCRGDAAAATGHYCAAPLLPPQPAAAAHQQTAALDMLISGGAAGMGSGVSLLQQVFVFEPEKLERMLAELLREGGSGFWKGVVRVPVSLAPLAGFSSNHAPQVPPPPPPPPGASALAAASGDDDVEERLQQLDRPGLGQVAAVRQFAPSDRRTSSSASGSGSEGGSGEPGSQSVGQTSASSTRDSCAPLPLFERSLTPSLMTRSTLTVSRFSSSGPLTHGTSSQMSAYSGSARQAAAAALCGVGPSTSSNHANGHGSAANALGPPAAASSNSSFSAAAAAAADATAGAQAAAGAGQRHIAAGRSLRQSLSIKQANAALVQQQPEGPAGRCIEPVTGAASAPQAAADTNPADPATAAAAAAPAPHDALPLHLEAANQSVVTQSCIVLDGAAFGSRAPDPFASRTHNATTAAGGGGAAESGALPGGYPVAPPNKRGSVTGAFTCYLPGTNRAWGAQQAPVGATRRLDAIANDTGAPAGAEGADDAGGPVRPFVDARAATEGGMTATMARGMRGPYSGSIPKAEEAAVGRRQSPAPVAHGGACGGGAVSGVLTGASHAMSATGQSTTALRRSMTLLPNNTSALGNSTANPLATSTFGLLLSGYDGRPGSGGGPALPPAATPAAALAALYSGTLAAAGSPAAAGSGPAAYWKNKSFSTSAFPRAVSGEIHHVAAPAMAWPADRSDATSAAAAAATAAMAAGAMPADAAAAAAGPGRALSYAGVDIQAPSMMGEQWERPPQRPATATHIKPAPVVAARTLLSRSSSERQGLPRRAPASCSAAFGSARQLQQGQMLSPVGQACTAPSYPSSAAVAAAVMGSRCEQQPQQQPHQQHHHQQQQYLRAATSTGFHLLGTASPRQQSQQPQQHLYHSQQFTSRAIAFASSLRNAPAVAHAMSSHNSGTISAAANAVTPSAAAQAMGNAGGVDAIGSGGGAVGSGGFLLCTDRTDSSLEPSAALMTSKSQTAATSGGVGSRVSLGGGSLATPAGARASTAPIVPGLRALSRHAILAAAAGAPGGMNVVSPTGAAAERPRNSQSTHSHLKRVCEMAAGVAGGGGGGGGGTPGTATSSSALGASAEDDAKLTSNAAGLLDSHVSPSEALAASAGSSAAACHRAHPPAHPRSGLIAPAAVRPNSGELSPFRLGSDASMSIFSTSAAMTAHESNRPEGAHEPGVAAVASAALAPADDVDALRGEAALRPGYATGTHLGRAQPQSQQAGLFGADLDAAMAAALFSGAGGEEAYHEVWATRSVDPVTNVPVIVLAQHDVSAKVMAERHLANVMEAEHRLLEQLFPKHILTHITEEWTQEAERAAAGLAAPGDGAGSPAGGAKKAGAAGGPNRNLRWRPVVKDCNALATWHPEVTLLFADIRGFTPMCKEVSPRAVMTMLNDLFSRFDAMLDDFGVFKVETIGDCYFIAGGLMHEGADGMAAVRDGNTKADPLHANKVFMFAKAMLAAAREVKMPSTGEPVQIRIGISSGPVVSGVVGTRMPRFCLFGDTVNTTSRMESTGVPGAIHASETTFQLLPSEAWEPTGGIEVKGKGTMATYLWHPEF
ncbi:hypothetical protein HXX76_008012 [Chlamydomonas incerta]|uniref:Guanylate cyclase domain-containing protein n=1 Tax=Chlamydomonas incerta TaxID=51695 RepID=A0A835SWB5_CHLIN|nr:hypothetical protein HXX76_008012 [Chlamydomonas incerta]|eukprot:KAG2434288.1 hypothetical protein HXX76_008012 [Chlamydomonas incerta]